jgi:hypothetical protein
MPDLVKFMLEGRSDGYELTLARSAISDADFPRYMAWLKTVYPHPKPDR